MIGPMIPKTFRKDLGLCHVICLLLTTMTSISTGGTSKCLLPPRTTAEVMISPDSTSEADRYIEHGLGELPIKVELQSYDPIADVIHPGVGAAQADDDSAHARSGVVYMYNESMVHVVAPNKYDGNVNGAIFATDSNNVWKGPQHMESQFAKVRAKIWLASDFPEPDFVHNWQIIRSNKGPNSFLKISHGLSMTPDYVTVQVRLGDTNFVVEGVGASMHPSNPTPSDDWGGVIFSYDSQYVQVWTASVNGLGALFTLKDGWGHNSGLVFYHGYVKIYAWKNFFGSNIYHIEIPLGPSLPDVNEVALNQSINTTTGLISVMFKTPTGQVFPTSGAMQNTNEDDAFGGIVYAYSSSKLYLWYPNISISNKYFAYVDQYWGNQHQDIAITDGLLTIDIWDTFETCPEMTTVYVTHVKSELSTVGFNSISNDTETRNSLQSHRNHWKYHLILGLAFALTFLALAICCFFCFLSLICSEDKDDKRRKKRNKTSTNNNVDKKNEEQSGTSNSTKHVNTSSINSVSPGVTPTTDDKWVLRSYSTLNEEKPLNMFSLKGKNGKTITEPFIRNTSLNLNFI